MNRKYILGFFIFVFVFLFVKTISVPNNQDMSLGDVIRLGDVNDDGKISSQDYIMIRKHIMKQITLNGIQKIAADINSDSAINATDYIIIKKKIINGETVPATKNTSTATPVPATPVPATPVPATPVPVILTLNHTSLSLDGGDSATLSASVSPGGTTVSYSSSNPRVATVDANGKVTANVAGSSIITATGSNGKTAQCTVNVSLNIDYHEIRYTEGDNSGTSIWYAIIPKKYKMHYIFGNDTIGGAERPSDVAKRVNATVAVNSQILGFPIVNGAQYGFDQNVSGYDFTVQQNPNFSMNNLNTPPWDALIVTATTDYSKGISFKDINLGFDYEGDHVKHPSRNVYLTLYAQLIMNRTSPHHFGPGVSNSSYLNKYYTQTEERQNERLPRTWIAYDSAGNQFVGVAMGRDYPLRDGRRIGQAGLTYQEIINVTRKYFGNDIVTLYNMDGGGSATFVYRGNKLDGNGDIDNNTGHTVERILYGTLYW